MVHDTGRGGQDDVTERTGGHEQVDPVLDLRQLDVEAGRDDTALVDATVELDDDLAGSVVVNLLELLNVTCCVRERNNDIRRDCGKGSSR